MKRQKVGVAMSGGVDSTVSAALLQKQGYTVQGFFMHLPLTDVQNQIERVRSVTQQLSVPLHIIDMRKIFSDTVIRSFVDQYRRGRTPNPCVICNQQIKFGALMQSMRSRGIDLMATGHYARIQRNSENRTVLLRGRDPKKDQSYFLCRLTAKQLNRLIFPLGEQTKKNARQLASDMGLRGVHGSESQDVCFLAGRSVADFFKTQEIPDRPGNMETTSGRILGRHRGIWNYTIGQRRGLDLPDATPWYVKDLDAQNNRVIVCKNDELMSRSLLLCDVLWAGRTPSLPWHGPVQLRSRHHPSPARITPDTEGRWRVAFDKPQRAVTPGQFAVFYQGEEVRGSGIIVPQRPVQEDQDP